MQAILFISYLGLIGVSTFVGLELLSELMRFKQVALSVGPKLSNDCSSLGRCFCYYDIL